MPSSLVCHCLIGIPGAGKSTLAQQWVAQDPNLVVICPDEIRDQLYGDPIIQGDWDAVKAQAQKQFEAAIATHHSILYDATNVKRVWRQELMASYPEQKLRWTAWQLLTPLKVCLKRNEQRDRQVPIDVVIDYAQFLNQEPPILAEGFEAIHDVPMDELHQVDWDKMRSLLSASV